MDFICHLQHCNVYQDFVFNAICSQLFCYPPVIFLSTHIYMELVEIEDRQVFLYSLREMCVSVCVCMCQTERMRVYQKDRNTKEKSQYKEWNLQKELGCSWSVI